MSARNAIVCHTVVGPRVGRARCRPLLTWQVVAAACAHARDDNCFFCCRLTCVVVVVVVVTERRPASTQKLMICFDSEYIKCTTSPHRLRSLHTRVVHTRTHVSRSIVRAFVDINQPVLFVDHATQSQIVSVTFGSQKVHVRGHQTKITHRLIPKSYSSENTVPDYSPPVAATDAETGCAPPSW